jgi:hypothetical protein
MSRAGAAWSFGQNSTRAFGVASELRKRRNNSTIRCDATGVWLPGNRSMAFMAANCTRRSG